MAAEQQGNCGRISLFILCLFAWGLSVASIADCSFLLIDSGSPSSFSGPSSYSAYSPSYRKLVDYEDYMAFGAFSYDQDRDEHYCVTYPDDMFEEYFNTAGKAARGFGVVASVSFGFTLLFIVATFLFLEPTVAPAFWNAGFGFALLSIPTQLLTFLVFLIDPCRNPKDYGATECLPGIAGGMSVVSAILFIVVAITMKSCVHPPVKPLVSISDMRSQHRRLGWTITILSLVTWILSVTAVADCTFVREGDRDSKYSELSEYGIFNYNANDPRGHICVSYSRGQEFSSSVRTARAFGTLAAILSGAAMLGILSLQLFLRRSKEVVWKAVRILVTLAVVCQVIIFAIFGDDDCSENSNRKCTPGPAAIIAALNVILLAILAGLCWGTGPPSKPFFKVEIMRNNDDGEDGHHRDEEGDTVGSDHDHNDSPPRVAKKSTDMGPPQKPSTRTTTLPDGSVKTERQYLDEQGQLVMEVVLEQPPEVAAAAEGGDIHEQLDL